MQSFKAQSHAIDATPMAVALDRVGHELGSLASQVDRLQDGLGPLLIGLAQERPHTMTDIQGLDAIAQTLAGLSDFVIGLGRYGAGQQVPIESLADRLPLSDLADRLSGRTTDTAAEDFELF